MKQVLQSFRTGKTSVVDVPTPLPGRRQLLVRTSRTLISAGTERMLVDFGKAGWLAKARQQPEKVRQVMEKVRTDGLKPTLNAVLAKLDQPVAMGYCNVGRVVEAGAAVGDFAIGQRVASNGKHAEYALVSTNLCAAVPDEVTDDEAAFTVLGAVALQGIRLAEPTLGETVVVSGLGLVGLMTVQLLRANGCRVLGLDFDAEKLALARRFGAQTVDLSQVGDPVAAAMHFSRGRGVDAVIVTASTKSSDPISHAARMSRKRGRIILVGVTGLELSRAEFYEKELTFQVSCSYGPGRYDPSYEEGGHDYPFGFVRWTEQRNFEAVLDLMATGRLDVRPLVTHRFAVEEAGRALDVVTGSTPSLGILLEYPSNERDDARRRTIALEDHGRASRDGARGVAFIGAGNYATGALIPAFKAGGARLTSVVSSAGVSGIHAARKFGFDEASTDSAAVLADHRTAAVVISTRHDSHARLVIAALEANKAIFVEKPLCLTDGDQDAIEGAYSAAVVRGEAPLLMVGLNRRFAPQVVEIARLLEAKSGPKAFVMTVNAGAIPSDHWTQDRETGGGRVIGEAVHFVDLLRFLAAAPIESFGKVAMASPSGDTATITLTFADGSIGTIHYFANGSKAFPKERLEVFASGGILQLDNFRTLRGFGWAGLTKTALRRQDKGQSACAKAFLDAIDGRGPAPIPIDEIFEVNRVTMALAAGI